MKHVAALHAYDFAGGAAVDYHPLHVSYVVLRSSLLKHVQDICCCCWLLQWSLQVHLRGGPLQGLVAHVDHWLASASAACCSLGRYIFVEVPHGVFPLSEILAGK
jgi:hypothetical protein